ncbi:hypothetical protein TRAPUB_13336 [Trametes pubescens]|uniref:Uncharacterized protein n=1 Tax=Trametes pubescens TaxID=154538 RepID=A0A1M2VRF5_TRAPU|nr:hypothetical protein TRAPUB_13336 [Trametes pubescens]
MWERLAAISGKRAGWQQEMGRLARCEGRGRVSTGLLTKDAWECTRWWRAPRADGRCEGRPFNAAAGAGRDDREGD